MSDEVVEVSADSEILTYIHILTGKITLHFYSKNVDYIALFVYIKAFHHLPKVLFGADNRSRISAGDALGYMKRELAVLP